MTTTRDTYRSKVYAAENAAFQESFGIKVPEGASAKAKWNAVTKSWPNALGGQRIETVPEIQAYVDKLTNSAWFKRRWPNTSYRGIVVKDGRRARRASGGFGCISFPRWSRVEWVILHELAHCLAGQRGGWHGQPFCKVYIELVTHQLGKESGDALKRELRARRVPLRERKKRIVA